MTDRNDQDREFSTELNISAPRDTVWEALASDQGLRRWFAPGASVDLRVGGEIVWNWTDHHTWVQRIEIVEPGTRLRTRYDSPVDDGKGGKRPLWIDFLLEGDGGSTTLRVVQSGFGPEADFDGEYDGISHGWPVELQSLRLYAERHAGHDRALAWSTHPTALAPDDAWQLVTGPRGFDCGADVGSWPLDRPFRFETAQGDVFEGRSLVCHPREFTGIATSHGDAFLRISTESCGDGTLPWLWLAAWERPASELEALQQRWDDLLTGLLAGTSAPSGAREA